MGRKKAQKAGNLAPAVDLFRDRLTWFKEGNYKLIRSLKECEQMIKLLSSSKEVAYDTETEGLSPVCHKVVGMSFSHKSGNAFYVPIKQQWFDTVDPRGLEVILEFIRLKELILFNAVFDYKMTKASFGIEIKVARDVMIEAKLLNKTSKFRGFGLKELTKEVLGFEQLKMEEILEGTHDFSLVYHEEDALVYAASDADFTLQLAQHYSKISPGKSTKLAKLIDIEVAVTQVVGEMELNGVYVDRDYTRSLDLSGSLLELEEEVANLTGVRTNLDSPQQLSGLLYDTLKLPEIFEKGRSTAADVLEAMKGSHLAIPKILEFKVLSKLQGSFLTKIDSVTCEDGRLRGSFHQLGAETGRFTASGGVGRGGESININLQQIPRPSPKANVRKCLAASPDFYWISVDFKQIEYAVLAYVSRDLGLMEAFARGVDIHTKTASILMGIPEDKVKASDRSKGKTLNFGMVYGMGIRGLAESLGVSVEEAKDLKNDYFRKIPGVSKLINETKKSFLESSYVQTEFGRRRYYDLVGKDEYTLSSYCRSAFNTRIQGTAADVNKIALAKSFRVFTSEWGKKVRFLSTIHDELNLEVSKDIPEEEAVKLVRQVMEVPPGILPGWLGIGVDIEVGPSFGELKECKNSEVVHNISENSKGVYDFQVPLTYIEKEVDASVEEAKPQVKPLVKPQVKPLVQNNRVYPHVVIKPTGPVREEHFSAIRKCIERSYGAFAVYFEIDGRTFFNNSFRVNPNPTFEHLCDVSGFSISKFNNK